jgi:catechol 2,3-dioxygenase-like lactoylglutathione lyase family enzyme
MPKKAMQTKKSRVHLAVNFNHALIHVKVLDPALHFYRDLLGFKEIDQIPGEYARLRSRNSQSTLALHLSRSPEVRPPGGVWLYLEVRKLDQLCRRLQAVGVRFSQKPELMPWGWRQAFLKDPDGHKLCLYWAGVKRLQTSKPPKNA